MTPTIQLLRAEQHVTIGDFIEQSVPEIIARWVKRVREEQPNAQRVHHDVLVDHLPVFLSKLGRSLATAGDASDGPRKEATAHGDQRWDNGWSITELVRDYQILRLVLIDFLETEMERRLSMRESLVLNVSIDDAIAAAVARFAASQTTPGMSDGTTRNEALDLLLNVLGVVGHELRNPLAPLTNSLEILKMAGTDPAHIEATRQMMDRQVHVLSRLVEDLMDLPRLARGKLSLVREPLDLTRLVRTCGEDRRAGLESAGLRLQLDVPADPVWTVGDETRLTQAIGNLIGNAQKFSEGDGAVTVRLTVLDGRKAVICVRDTGIGIEASLLPKVFEAYTQADHSANRRRGGLGLGLALVKGVVELHGGTVQAASAGQGKGATFTIDLPIVPIDLPAPSENQADIAPVVKPRRVLIIEDNRDSAESLKVFLELHGHTVVTAVSGQEGIKTAEFMKPEVVICDVGLPGMDGYAVAAELRKSLLPPPNLIIAVSGHGARKGQDGEADRLFDYYLLKPADPVRVARLLSADRHPIDLETLP
jgi:signal transduction histidine kinase/ActR/RegA family two-component response regulator